ncbi:MULTISPECIES: winged helix-turn-helix domain-containing protein [Chromohalobacter]|uniref:Two component transcriptional regulator, winged helix family n=1 Tax=Chromohalobacter israelensis (strain ATCC BAA-138 / DSM 3043 / CIP 106854 / NCIMB 13768 / 1H11) TaxID=290398 RepID=Q1QZW6_CHRI1|nr:MULTISPECIES: response regulator transcription factor [Chromohalobacter]ABE57992.1 two component transcriptional regulator, winged helix family [Chromohalobacter salexigens DSM 3043]MDF9433866.1 response regulator transcription factor [Chromohalobacter israelensis]MDO0946996.1 response regulator transcription factor [Chromohalobacter salexigens]NWO57168.1 DNA-binding response regulator [Chromohalobacter salexigens]PWW39491.1 winged helix family two component transcriptional regulator [Chrom
MKVLLVEDDTALAQALGEAFVEAGLLWEHAANGEAADYLVRVEAYDAVILDLGLPDGDGTRWLAAWREDGIDLPVLVLTARERWSDKAAGFSAGADDYVTKPFETAEVLFRLRALVRRSHGHAHPILKLGELALDTHTGSVTLAGRPITLTAQESRLLAYLLHAAPRIVTRTELSEHVYDRDHEPDSNVIDVQISRLRRKLGNQRIETLRGQGYRLVALEETP